MCAHRTGVPALAGGRCEWDGVGGGVEDHDGVSFHEVRVLGSRGCGQGAGSDFRTNLTKTLLLRVPLRGSG